MLDNMELIKFIKSHYLILIVIVILPLFLNVVLQLPSLFPIVSDAAGWLQFWPMYFSSIASFVMIYYTARTLIETQRQNQQLREEQREAVRARLVFDVIISQNAYFLRITNTGKENAYNVQIEIDEDSLSYIPEHERPIFRNLNKPFAVLVDKPVYLYIGFCQNIIDAWKGKDVVIKMTGSYNDKFDIKACVDMSQYIDKLHFVVDDELTTAVKYIKNGLIVQNNQYYPIQKSLSIIARHIERNGIKVDVVIEDKDKEDTAEDHKIDSTLISTTD